MRIRLLQTSETVSRARHQFELFDDFLYYVSTDLWTSLAADTNSSVAESSAHGGILVINTGDNTDNNEAGVATSNELFKFAADKPFFAEAYIQYTEVNTSAANVAFGFADAFGANLIADNGASVGINSSGVLIYKVDGGTVWRCNSENNGTAVDTASVTTAGGSAYQTLAIEGRAVDGTNYELTFFVDGLPLRDSSGKAIKHTLAYASATEMDFGVYGKNGATNTLTVKVDYIYTAWGR